MMGQALSDDLRIRVLKASASGMSARQAAARFGVGISTAIRWIARARQGELRPRPQGWRRPSAVDAHEEFVIALIDDRKDVTLDEMVGRLFAAMILLRSSPSTSRSIARANAMPARASTLAYRHWPTKSEHVPRR